MPCHDPYKPSQKELSTPGMPHDVKDERENGMNNKIRSYPVCYVVIERMLNCRDAGSRGIMRWAKYVKKEKIYAI
jgi:hypothetical protein